MIEISDIEKEVAQEAVVEAKAAPDKFAFKSLGNLLSEPDEKISYVVDGLLPSGGLSVLASKPKAGKSTLARQVGLSVARGDEFLGRETSKGAVLYVSFEDKPDEVKRRFRMLGGAQDEKDENLYVYVGSAPREAHEWLEREIKRRKPVLVIIDTLFRFVTIKNGNDYAEVTAALSPVLALARENGAHLMVVHHAGKSDRGGGDSILGSTAIFGSVDTAIILKRTESKRTIETQQRYGTDMVPTVLVFDEAAQATTLGGTKEEDDVQRVTDEILAFLSDQTEPCVEKLIEDGVEGSTRLKHKALRDLVAKALVNRIGGGKRNDPYLYSRSLVPDIGAEQEKQETKSLENAHSRAVNSSSDPTPTSKSL
jgi:predicted ATP-dependent serine protease